MDRQKKSETSGSPLTAAENELRIEVVAHLQTEEASDIATDAIIDAAPVRVRAEPLVNLVQQRADAGKSLINDFACRTSNALFQ